MGQVEVCYGGKRQIVDARSSTEEEIPIESLVEIVEVKEKQQEFEAVIPTGKVELEDIKEIKRGFSMPIPHSNLHNNLIQRVK